MRQARVLASRLFEYGSSWTTTKASRVSEDRVDDEWGDWEAWQVGSSGRLDQSIAVVLFGGECQQPKQDVTRKFGWVWRCGRIHPWSDGQPGSQVGVEGASLDAKCDGSQLAGGCVWW